MAIKNNEGLTSEQLAQKMLMEAKSSFEKDSFRILTGTLGDINDADNLKACFNVLEAYEKIIDLITQSKYYSDLSGKLDQIKAKLTPTKLTIEAYRQDFERGTMTPKPRT